MREIEERSVDFGEKGAEGGEEFGGVRFCFGKGGAGDKREEPNEAGGAVFGFDAGKEVAICVRNDARESKMRGTGGKMGQGAALHVHEGIFAGGMHKLQNKGPGIGTEELEIVVVFAREGACSGFEAVEFEGDTASVRRGERRSDTSFGHHARNCNGTASD